MDKQLENRTRILKETALRFGFDGVGISKAEFMEGEAERLEEWLNKGFHGEMTYMERYRDMRVDPTQLVPGAKSVVSLMYNYFPSENNPSVPLPSLKISRYAYGEDYHKVIRRKLKAMLAELKKEFGSFHARVFVDSGPVMERDWAKRSGLGWIGKNTLLIHPKKGSYFFLAEIILDLEFAYDDPIEDFCGTCTRCIDACPTDAIQPGGYVLDGSKCISYLTIELKNEIPVEFKGKTEGWIFGCDICQEVCPWNRFSKPTQEEAFRLSPEMMDFITNVSDLTEEKFEVMFSKSPVKRTGYTGLKRNIRFVMEKKEYIP